VDMVVHQTVRQELKLELLSVDGQPSQVSLPIPVVPKDVAPLIATHDHVIQPTSHFHPQRTRHHLNTTIPKD